MSKGQAEYIDKAQDPSQECDACKYFHPPMNCDRVMGRISPEGWCKLFEAKEGDNQMGQKAGEEARASALGVVTPGGTSNS